MKIGKQISLAAIVGVLLFSSGCILPERSRPGYGRHERTYYYYPDDEVYYYPYAREYYWLEGRKWKHGPAAPRRYHLRERGRVKLESDYQPHTRHAQIKARYPGRNDKERDEERNRSDRDKGKDRDRDRDRDKK